MNLEASVALVDHKDGIYRNRHGGHGGRHSRPVSTSSLDEGPQSHCLKSEASSLSLSLPTSVTMSKMSRVCGCQEYGRALVHFLAVYSVDLQNHHYLGVIHVFANHH